MFKLTCNTCPTKTQRERSSYILIVVPKKSEDRVHSRRCDYQAKVKKPSGGQRLVLKHVCRIDVDRIVPVAYTIGPLPPRQVGYLYRQ